MFSTTISAIRRGAWLIDRSWAQAHADLITRTLKGEKVDWGTSNEKFIEKDPKSSLPKRIKVMAADDPQEIYKASPWTSPERLPYNSIVMVDIVGPILKYGDVCSYGTVDYNNLMVKLASSKNVAGIIMNFDTPGGQAAGTAIFAKTIRQTSKIKPVVGIVQDAIAASAGEWLFSACQECYVSEDTDEVGSIGAYTTLYDFDAYLESQGLKSYTIYAPQSVDKNADYRQVIESEGKEKSIIEADLKFLVDDFIKDVKMFRGDRLKTNKENPFTGKMYKAAEAIKIGLIDGQKDLPAVVKRVQNLISLRNQNTN